MATVQAYCVKCRQKRDMLTPKPIYTRTGTAGTEGKCPTCGTKLFRMGTTPAHAGIPKPTVVEKPKRKAKRKKKA